MVNQHAISIEGRPAKFWIGGAGKPLVLLHGGLGDARQHWAPSFAALSPEFQIIAPDLPGFGVSAPLPLPSYQAYLSWLQSLFDVLSLGTPLLMIGNSFGAALSRLYAAISTDQIGRLVLVDGGAIPDVPGCARPLFRLPGLNNLLIEWIRKADYSTNDLKRAIHVESLLTLEFVANAQTASHGFVAAMKQIAAAEPPTLLTPTCSTLIVWGEFDRLSSPANGQQLVTAIPGSHFIVLKDAGHMPQIEQPDAFHAAVLPFLRGEGPIAHSS